MASTLGFVIAKGLFSARPAAGVPGRLYYATDDTVLYRDNGTTWDELAVGSGYTDAELAAHVAAADPHGDRAYADTTFIPLAQRAAHNGVATLDAAGKIPSSQLPGSAVTDVFVVASEAAMLALSTADVGDIAIRTDTSTTYVLAATPPSTLANWSQLLFPGGVSSVDGRSGAVTLNDLYDAAGAATAAVSTHNSATTSVHGIANTADIILEGDLRLTNDRTPTAHAASHELAGSDELAIAPSQITQDGAAAGEVLAWDGATWAPAASGGLDWSSIESAWYGAPNVIATTIQPFAISLGSQNMTAGNVIWSFFKPHRDLAITKLSNARLSAGSGATVSRLGLYTVTLVGTTVNMTLVARTASTHPVTTGLPTSSLDTAGGYPASYTLMAGVLYAIGYIFTGTTPGNAAVTNPSNGIALYAGFGIPHAAVATGATDLPTSVSGAGTTTSTRFLFQASA